jgi:hypothetical protein
MNDPDHCAERAMFIVALDDTDAERRAAIAHARACANCSRALSGAERLLRELDAVASPGAPSPRALQVTLHAVRALDEGAARSQLSRQAAALTLLAGVSLALLSRHRAPEPSWPAFALVLGVATVLASVALRRPAVVLIVTLLLALGLPYGRGLAELSPAIGLKCLAFELLAGALPLLTVIAAGRRRSVSPTATELAALAAAGSLAGGAALIVACPASHAFGHVFAFHTGGALLALVAGFIAYPLLRSEAT